MAVDNKGNEIMAAGDGYVTMFPSYNATADGQYLPDWNAMVNVLDKPVNLAMTIDDFLVLKKKDAKAALALKFRAGGYDGGACPLVRNLKTGKVKPSRAGGVPRPEKFNIVVLDIDTKPGQDLPAGFDEKVISVLQGYEFYMHATISSKLGNLRRRLIVPLAAPVNISYREAFIRFIADKIGMEYVDPASVRNKQLMTFPVHCAGGDTYHYHGTGNLMGMDYLPANVADTKTWPKWASESEEVVIKHSKRPRKVFVESGEWKPVHDDNKIHNAFNKAYKISDILKEHGYVPGTVPGRWSHTYDDCADGIKVTNDSILYSYYGTDPLSTGSDLDAFEVALVLQYGDIADKKNWKAMTAEASKDENVRNALTNDYELPADAQSWALLYDDTEEGLAQRCVAYFPHVVRNGDWYRYNNELGIYQQVKDKALINDALLMIRIAAALQPDKTTLQEMVGRVNVAKNIVTAWYALLLEKPAPEFETNNWLLNFNDVTIDLKKYCDGEEDFVLDHSPEFMLTESTGYNWTDVANVDETALDEVIKNMEIYLPDQDVRDYFQMSVGRCLAGSAAATEDKCVFMMGPEAGNGKSTTLNAIRGALGSYYYDMKGKYLYYSSRDSETAEAPSPALAGMENKRLVNFTEYDGVRTLDGEKYKTYTSAGYIRARKLNCNDNSFRAKCCCVIDCNGMPGLQRRDPGVTRRTRVVPWLASLSGDSTIKSKWLTDHKIHAAMMAWLLMGLHMWYANGLQIDCGIDTAVQAVWQETTEWVNAFDDPVDFFSDMYIVTGNEKDFLIADDAFETYCTQVYDRGASRHAFRQAEARWLRQHGITRKAKRDVGDGRRLMCYVGVYLRVVENYSSYGRYSHINNVSNTSSNAG